MIKNRPFPSCFEPHYESEAKGKVFIMKISFHSYANKINFQMKSFALSLAFIMSLTATQRWPIAGSVYPISFLGGTPTSGMDGILDVSFKIHGPW